MKRVSAIAFLVALSGCVHYVDSRCFRNLDGYVRTGITRTHDVIVDAQGNISLLSATNAPVSRWQIHPDAPLGRVAGFSADLTEDERIELWTSRGICLVSGPTYGSRRLPSFFGSDHPVYTIHGHSVSRNGTPWFEGTSDRDLLARIFADIRGRKKLGIANLYFVFSPTSTWSDVDSILVNALPRVHEMRGLWLGLYRQDGKFIFPLDASDDGNVVLNLHDITRLE